MKVPVILLNYNSSDDCRKCVGFLFRQEGVELEVVIVDNASAPDDAAKVRDLCHEFGLTFIAADTNRGYNAGNNIGLRYAASKGYRYAMIANPDMEFPDPAYIATLAAELDSRPEVAVIGSDILTPERIHQNPMLPDGGWKASLNWIKYFFHRKNRQDSYSFIGDHTQSAQCAKLSGCALMIRLDFISKIGFFDEHPFLYCEEAILSKQTERSGYTMRYIATMHAIHRHIPSAKGDPRPRFRQWRRSRLYFIRHYSDYPWYGRIISIISWHVYFSLLILYSSLHQK